MYIRPAAGGGEAQQRAVHRQGGVGGHPCAAAGDGRKTGAELAKQQTGRWNAEHRQTVVGRAVFGQRREAHQKVLPRRREVAPHAQQVELARWSQWSPLARGQDERPQIAGGHRRESRLGVLQHKP